MQAHHLGIRIGGYQIGNAVQIRRRRYHHDLADRHPRRCRHAGKHRLPVRLRGAVERARHQRVGQHTGQLRRHSDQKGLVTFVEAAFFLLLNHQHPQHSALVDDGHAKEARKAFLPSLGKIPKLRMTRRILEIQRLLPLADQADQALAQTQRHDTHGLGTQTDGVHQHQTIALAVEQIDGTDIGAHRLADAAHHGGQRGIQATGAVDFLNDAAKGIEHEPFSCGRGDPRRGIGTGIASYPPDTSFESRRLESRYQGHAGRPMNSVGGLALKPGHFLQ